MTWTTTPQVQYTWQWQSAATWLWRLRLLLLLLQPRRLGLLCFRLPRSLVVLLRLLLLTKGAPNEADTHRHGVRSWET